MDCQLGPSDSPMAVRTTQCIRKSRAWSQGIGPFQVDLWAGLGTDETIRRRFEPDALLRIILKPELGRIRLPLVRPANPSLHFVLDSVEGLDLDQRVVLPALDPAVQSRESAIDRVAEDVRNCLAGPSAPGLRPVSVAVQLLANLRDPLSLKITAEDQGDDPGLFLLHLKKSVHVILAVRAPVGQARSRFLHRTAP